MKSKLTSYQKIVLILTCATLASISFDYFGFTIALPDIGKEFDLGTSQIGWIMNASQLSFAASIIGIGRFADMIGRTRLMIGGCVVFGIAAAMTASADGLGMLIAGRAINGLSNAMIAVTGLSVLTHVFDRHLRSFAIGFLTASSLGAGIFAPFAAGAVTQYLSWRWFFLMDGILATVCFVLLLVFLREPQDAKKSERFDFVGFLMMASGIVLFIYSLDAADKLGWQSATVIGGLAGGIALLIGLYFAERWVKDPLIHFTLFKDRDFLGGCLVIFFTQVPGGALMMFLTLYLQHVLGLSPVMTGLVFLASMVPGTTISLFSGSFHDKMGNRVTLGLASALLALCFVTFGFYKPGNSIVFILVGLALYGLGQTIAATTTSAVVMAAAPAEKSGQAAGLLKSIRAIGATFGVACAGVLFRTSEQVRLSHLYDLAGSRLTQTQQSEIRSLLSGSDAAREKLRQIAPDLNERVHLVISDAYAHAFRDVMFFFVACAAIAFLSIFIVRGQQLPDEKADSDEPDVLPQKVEEKT
ncbi:MAG: MFS transporter [Pseudomonadota bacterium]